MEVREKIRHFITANFMISNEDANVSFEDHENIFSLGFVNSMFAMKLLNYIESEFGFRVDNEDININNFRSVDNMVLLVNKMKGALR